MYLDLFMTAYPPSYYKHKMNGKHCYCCFVIVIKL